MNVLKEPRAARPRFSKLLQANEKIVTLSLPLQKIGAALVMQQQKEKNQQNRTNDKLARKWRVPVAAEDSLRLLKHALSNAANSNQQVTALLSNVNPSVIPSKSIYHAQDSNSFSRLARTHLPEFSSGDPFHYSDSYHFDTLGNVRRHNLPDNQQNKLYGLASTELIGESVKRFYVDLTPAQECMLLRKANRYVNLQRNQRRRVLEAAAAEEARRTAAEQAAQDRLATAAAEEQRAAAAAEAAAEAAAAADEERILAAAEEERRAAAAAAAAAAADERRAAAISTLREVVALRRARRRARVGGAGAGPVGRRRGGMAHPPPP